MTQIKAHGGVASFNHPFGTGTAVPTEPQRSARILAVMTSVLGHRLSGADSLEVGYNARDMDLAGHLELLDCLNANANANANARAVTATGVSDDHDSTPWNLQPNRFVTVPLMRTLDEATLTAALRVGRACVGMLGDFTGALDISLNRAAFQGQILVSTPKPTDTVVVDAVRLPLRQHRGGALRAGRHGRHRVRTAPGRGRRDRGAAGEHEPERAGRRLAAPLLPGRCASLVRRHRRLHEPRLVRPRRLAMGAR